MNPVSLVPIEIWDAIFALACDPSGGTAAAISQVSRYFYKAIGPYRFKSLAIYGERRIVAFYEAMKTVPPDVPRAKHLYIALVPDSYVRRTRQICDTVIDKWIHQQKETREERKLRIDQHLNLLGFYNDTGGAIVSRIISQHRDTLRTLTYLAIVRNISFGMFECLPYLEDLTVVSLRCKSTFLEVRDDDPVHGRTQFPSLKRLHLSDFDTTRLFDHDEFRRIAPNLSQLRMSGRKCYLRYEKLSRHPGVLMQPVPSSSSRARSEQIPHMGEMLSNESCVGRVVILVRRGCGRYGFFDALQDWLDATVERNAFWDGDNGPLTAG